MEQDKIPQDIKEAARIHAHLKEGFDEAEELHYNCTGMNAYHSYIAGRMEERAAHTVVSTDVEQMAATRYKIDNDQSTKSDYNKAVIRCREGYIVGYNAAIQSQSVQPKWDKINRKMDIALDGMTLAEWQQLEINAKKRFNLGVQPTGSVREIAKREFDNLMENIDNEDISIWTIWMIAYDSAARNLPVGNRWTDNDMEIAFESGQNNKSSKQVSYGMLGSATETRYKQTFEQWLQQYKLTHSLAGNTTEK